jgi:D-glycerate 3-kinase
MTPAEQQFLLRNQLPDSYLVSAEKWFAPLLACLAQKAKRTGPPLVIGINGSQGSGKSTLADYLCSMLGERHKLRCVSLSLDDFYLTRQQRAKLATEIHPLLQTRGVPGTHDIPLALQTLNSLIGATDESNDILIPRFDKSQDERRPAADCDSVKGPLDIILFEGWCVGAKPQADEQLQQPVNNLEAQQDSQGVWRRYVNQALAGEYQTLFQLLDLLIMLQAPSFDAVFNWRLEQEEKLIARLGGLKGSENSTMVQSGIMSAAQIADFIAHYQRITEQSLREMPQRADHLFKLDNQRRIISAQSRY